MNWHGASLRLLDALPRDDRDRLRPELAAVLGDTEAHHGVSFRDAASIGSLVAGRWMALGVRHPRELSAGFLALASALILTYVAVTAYQLNNWVNTSLPCDPSVLTSTDPLIDPAGAHLYNDQVVAASQSHFTCLTESKSLLAAEGITSKASLLYWPLLVAVNGVAAVFATTAIALRLSKRSARRNAGAMLMKVIAIVGLVALASQALFAETISVLTVIVE